MHIEPHPITHIIKQQILVYVECTSNTEFKDNFAPELVGKNTTASLMTILLDKVGFLSITVLFICKYCTKNSVAAYFCIQKPSAQVCCLT